MDGSQPAPKPELVIRHTDADREYAYDRDPVLGSGTEKLLAAATEHEWSVIDMAADWTAIHAQPL